jgi:hypothetical protein
MDASLLEHLRRAAVASKWHSPSGVLKALRSIPEELAFFTDASEPTALLDEDTTTNPS